MVEIAMPENGSRSALEVAAAQTEEALRAGTDVIFLPGDVLPDGLRGHTDFLLRVDRPSDLGDYCYEVADTKLARSAKPYFILQLCFYSELLAAARAASPSTCTSFSATARQRASASPSSPPTSGACASASSRRSPPARRHLPRARSTTAASAAGASDCDAQPARRRPPLPRRGHPSASGELVAAGITTLAELGTRHPSATSPAIRAPTLEKLREQARAPAPARETGRARLRAARARGRARLRPPPEPSPGDVFFDMEGDPFYERRPRVPVRRRHGDGRRAASSTPSGAATAPRRSRVRGVHRLRRASGASASRTSTSTTTPLRADRAQAPRGPATAPARTSSTSCSATSVFVDLYGVVRQGMRISQPCYSLKKVEAFYMEQRETTVTEGGDSIVAFEEWLEDRRDRDPRRDRGVQRGRLPVDAASCATGCSSGARRPRASSREPRPLSGSTGSSMRLGSAREKATGDPRGERGAGAGADGGSAGEPCASRCRPARPSTDGALAGVPPPRGAPGLVGLLRPRRSWNRRC